MLDDNHQQRNVGEVNDKLVELINGAIAKTKKFRKEERKIYMASVEVDITLRCDLLGIHPHTYVLYYRGRMKEEWEKRQNEWRHKTDY